VTVPVEELPPITEAGDKATLASVGTVIAKIAVSVADPKVAVIVADVLLDTAVVVTVKVAEVELAGIDTDVGTDAVVPLTERLTVTPPGPAGPFKVTVPVEGEPPTTETGESERPVNKGRLTVRIAD